MSSSKIAAFDWDYTLIKPINGVWKGSAEDPSKSDWFNDSVPAALESLYRNGYQIIIFSQRASLKQSKFFDRRSILVRKRYDYFLKQLSFKPTIVITCSNNSIYCKPSIAAWNFITKDVIFTNKAASLYVGDCAGRPYDRSDNDYLFAKNVGVDFFTPEYFFKDDSKIVSAS